MLGAYILLGAWLGVAVLYWLYALYASVQTVRKVPRLCNVEATPPTSWPRLSVVVAARNEEDSIATAMQSLLEQDYPNLQIVLVDDRSEDRTGEIIDDLAGRDARVAAVHLRDLPAGWLGKVHALQRGLEACDGTYVLFTDADVHFSGDVLRRAVAWCERDRLDLLAALPGLWPTGGLLTAMIATFLRQLNMRMRFWAVGDPRSKAYMGVGAFNLVRREALDRTPGFEWLRLEIGDDAGLGLMVKRSGGRCVICNARQYLGLHWYSTIAQMMRGMEKGFAPIADCRLWRAAMTLVMLLALEWAPPAALLGGAVWAALGGGAWAWAMLGGGTVMVGCAVAGTAAAGQWAGIPLRALLYWPASVLVMAAGMVRMTVMGLRRGGVQWRDTFYTCRELRQNRRVKL